MSLLAPTMSGDLSSLTSQPSARSAASSSLVLPRSARRLVRGAWQLAAATEESLVGTHCVRTVGKALNRLSGHRGRRHALSRAASESGAMPSAGGPLDDAAGAMERCLGLFLDHNLVNLVGYVPEDVVVSTVIHNASSDPGEPVSLEDCIDTMLRQHPSAHFMDSYAIRLLVLAAPQQIQPLSALQLSPERFVQRCRVVAASGEECVVTFTLQARQGSAPRAARSWGRQPWALVRVEGEPSYPDAPEAPSPEFSPEQVVAGQLAALQRRDVAAAFAFASPKGQAVAGTCQQFGQLLQGDARFTPLLGHAGTCSIRRCHSQARTYVEVVQVDGQDTGPRLYCWVVSLQAEGAHRDCWMVDCVTPIHDPRLLRALMPQQQQEQQGQ